MSTKFERENIFTGILVMCALIITGMVIFQFFQSKDFESSIVDREVDSWEEISLVAYRKGVTKAPIQIIKFFDYSCPYCKEVDPVLNDITKKYSDQISIVYNHFPLDEFSNTFKAAVASECAANQGRFMDYHNLLFINQDNLETLSFDSLAIEAKVQDISLFKECRESDEAKDIIRKSVSIANDLGIGGVPTFLINDKIVPGVRSNSEFSSLIEELLKKQPISKSLN